jgi:hypothetical protein
MPILKPGQSQINIVTTKELHDQAKEQSLKLFGKVNIVAYFELIVKLDAASGVLDKFRKENSIEEKS